MDTTTFVVCGFHRGRKLKPQHFSTEAQARECAAHMGKTFDCVMLTTRTIKSSLGDDGSLATASDASMKNLALSA